MKPEWHETRVAPLLGSKNPFPNFGTLQGDTIDRSDSNAHLDGDPLPANARARNMCWYQLRLPVRSSLLLGGGGNRAARGANKFDSKCTPEKWNSRGPWRHMPVRSCRVTIPDMDGVSHSVEITAASLYQRVITTRSE